MTLIVSAVCLAVAAAGISVAVFSSPGGQAHNRVAATGNSPSAKAEPQPRPSAAPAASSPSTTGARVTSDGVAKSALRWPARLDRQIQRWKAGPGGAALVSVTKQMGTAMQAAGVKLYPAMRLTCVSLASEVRTAQAAPRIPDRAMQQLYARALTGLSIAAADCRKAISEHREGDENLTIHVNHALLNQARLEFAAASKKLYRATAQIS